MTTVELTPEDALLFISFQKRHAFMQLLENIGAFDLKSGSVEIHFTSTGEIGAIDMHSHLKVIPIKKEG